MKTKLSISTIQIFYKNAVIEDIESKYIISIVLNIIECKVFELKNNTNDKNFKRYFLAKKRINAII